MCCLDRWIDGSMDRWIRSTVDAPAQLHTHSMAPQQNTTMIKTEGAKNSAALIWEICCVVAWIDGSKVGGPAQLHTKQGTTAVPYYPPKLSDLDTIPIPYDRAAPAQLSIRKACTKEAPLCFFVLVAAGRPARKHSGTSLTKQHL
jgi:hypothetical protein